MPCKARSVPENHNAETAYFDIPADIEHGCTLICSHPQCAASGRRFRFCKFCDLPVAKRNFQRRHSHGQPPPPKDESNKRSDNEDDDDSSSASVKKKARMDDRSITPTGFENDQRLNLSYELKDRKNEEDCSRMFQSDPVISSDTKPSSTLSMVASSNTKTLTRGHDFESLTRDNFESPILRGEESRKPQEHPKNVPRVNLRQRWEESSLAPNLVASPEVGMRPRFNQRQDEFYNPQEKTHIFRQQHRSSFSEFESRQTRHNTSYPGQEPRYSMRVSERSRTSRITFEYEQMDRHDRQSTESTAAVTCLSPRENQWLQLLHSRPSTDDVEAMQRWMNSVVRISSVPTATTSPRISPHDQQQTYRQDVGIETPSTNVDQDDTTTQNFPRTPPPMVYPNNSNLSTGSRDISPIGSARRLLPDDEVHFHPSESSRNYDSRYHYGTYDSEDRLDNYFSRET